MGDYTEHLITQAGGDGDESPEPSMAEVILRTSRLDLQDALGLARELTAAGFGPVKEAKAVALEEAADEMDAVIACGDVAEVAAPVEWGVGRRGAISDRDSLYEEPSYWLRARADSWRGES